MLRYVICDTVAFNSLPLTTSAEFVASDITDKTKAKQKTNLANILQNETNQVVGPSSQITQPPPNPNSMVGGGHIEGPVVREVHGNASQIWIDLEVRRQNDLVRMGYTRRDSFSLNQLLKVNGSADGYILTSRSMADEWCRLNSTQNLSF